VDAFCGHDLEIDATRSLAPSLGSVLWAWRARTRAGAVERLFAAEGAGGVGTR
jgi:hypothetical protein